MLLAVTVQQVLIAAGIFVASTLISTAIVVTFLVWIPADHFVSARHSLVEVRSTTLRLTLRIGKNALGFVLVCLGVVLSLPGVPGQGLLTILVGVLLLDIPGKRRAMLRIVRRPAILRTINRLRARFRRDPLVMEHEQGERELPMDSGKSNVAEP